MLKISREQYTQWQSLTWERFRKQLEAHLGEVQRAAGAESDPQTLEYTVNMGLHECRRFGFRTEAEIARYIEIRAGDYGGRVPPALPDAAEEVLTAHDGTSDGRLEHFEAWAAESGYTG